MAYQFSSFISYRHNEIDNKYFVNLKQILASEVFKVTNKPRSFFDDDSIDWGVTWDDKIYEGIGESFFFLPIWYYQYLNENNLWCARELYHALQIEKIIKSQLSDDDSKKFFFIFPLIYRGTADLLPECFHKKNAKPLLNLENDVINKKVTVRLTKFSNDIYNSLMHHYLILERYRHVDFQALFDALQRPTDDEIKEWIREQKRQMLEKESGQSPVLTKHEE